MTVRTPSKRRSPSLRLEKALWADGQVVVGIDEVGRGAWAGPLTIGAAVLPADKRVYKVRDSKMLTEPAREQLFERLGDWCVAWAVGHASAQECDDLGMSAAQKLAAARALGGLGVDVDHILLDGKWDFASHAVPGAGLTKLVKGDAHCLSIATASILAKVSRDRIMRGEADHYPHYGFDENKGYPCPHHIASLAGWGPSAIHRRSWVFMDKLCWTGVPRTIRPEQPTLF